MNIVTIDWDYFFPDGDAFDWGHSELNSIFYEMAWLTRPSCRSMFGPLVGQRAVDVFHTDPTRLKQVSLLMKNWNPSFVFVAESHQTAYDVIHDLDLRKINLWNLDAHHDAGYKSEAISCDNWVKFLRKEKRLVSYNVVYPAWRKDRAEMKAKSKINTTYYELPSDMPNPHLLFICRSPAWTPTWTDNEWVDFVAQAEALPGFTAKSLLNTGIKTLRFPDLENAKALAASMDKHFAEFLKQQNAARNP